MNFFLTHFWSKKWSIFLFFSLGLYLLVMFKYNIWNYGGISRMEPLFADTHIVLAAAECHQKGYDVFRENPCDALGRPHCYSRLWFAFGSVGLNSLHTNIIGGIVITIFLLLSITIVSPQSKKELLFSSILIFSPSVMLGVERGNMDLMIFSLLIISGYLLFSKKNIFRYLSYVLILLMAFLKFYPIASFGACIQYSKNRKNFWLLILIIIIVFGLFLWMTHEDFLQLRNNIPRPHGWLSFGVASLLSTISKGKLLAIGSLITTSIIIITGYFLSFRTKNLNRTKNSLNTTFFLLGSFNLFFCFFVNTNYDYRTIFYILVMPYIFDLLRTNETTVFTRRLTYVFLSLLAISMWFNFIRYLLEFVGKTTDKSNLIENFIWAFFVLKQIGSWGSITILIALNIEVLRYPFKEKILGIFPLQKFQK